MLKVMMMMLITTIVSGYGITENQYTKEIDVKKVVEGINFSTIIMFASTFNLIEADIEVTRVGITYHKYREANPIARTFTDRQDWEGLSRAAIIGNTLGFLTMTLCGELMSKQFNHYYPYLPKNLYTTILQVFYTTIIYCAEIAALNSWASVGFPIYVKIQPLYITF